MKLTKENIKSISDFIKTSVKTLMTSDFTCCKYDLDSDLGLFVGWLGGYSENDNTCIHHKKDKSCCLNVGIKVRNDFYWCDYECLLMPIFSDVSGEIYDDGISIQPNENYKRLARYFIKSYNNVSRLIKKHKLILDY